MNSKFTIFAFVFLFGLGQMISSMGQNSKSSKVSFPFEHPPVFPLPQKQTSPGGQSKENGGDRFGALSKLPEITSENPLVNADAFINEIASTDRLVLRTDDGSTQCLTCGGFSTEATGQCCTACGRLNYKACWCRSCDCLCYNN